MIPWDRKALSGYAKKIKGSDYLYRDEEGVSRKGKRKISAKRMERTLRRYEGRGDHRFPLRKKCEGGLNSRERGIYASSVRVGRTGGRQEEGPRGNRCE